MKTYKVFDQFDIHDYDITVHEEDGKQLFTLYRSSVGWSESAKNEKVMEIEDNGDGYKFPKLGREIDYQQAAELHIMFIFISKYDKLSMFKGKIVECSDFVIV